MTTVLDQKSKQIQDLLGSNLSAEIVASAVGVDPSYVSQLMSDPEFADVVVEKRSKALTANTQRDLSIDSLEDRVINKLGQMLDYIVKPEQLLNAFRIINGAKRRGVAPLHQATATTTVVTLSLPEVVKKKFVLSNQGEIVEVEGQTLLSMGSIQLLNKLKAERGQDGARYGKLAEQISQEELPVTRATYMDRAALKKLIDVTPTKELEDVTVADL